MKAQKRLQIDINRNIASGLMTVPEGETAEVADDETPAELPAWLKKDDIVA